MYGQQGNKQMLYLCEINVNRAYKSNTTDKMVLFCTKKHFDV